MNIVNDSNFKEEVINQKGLVIVDFFADWCGPCRAFLPVLEEYSKKNTNVKVVKVNVDDSPEVSANHGIMSIPTIVVYYSGHQVEKKTGSMTISQLEEFNRFIK